MTVHTCICESAHMKTNQATDKTASAPETRISEWRAWLKKNGTNEMVWPFNAWEQQQPVTGEGDAPREKIPFIGTVDAEVVGANYDARNDVEYVNEALANYGRVTAQRDELLAALKLAVGSRLFSIDFEANRMPGTEQTDIRNAMVAAIAKAEGRAQ